MIHSDKTAWRRRLRRGITIGLGLWLAIRVTGPALACSQHYPCTAGAIDGFFLPLITSSLGKTVGAVASSRMLAPTPIPSPLPLSGGATVIPPPALPETAIRTDQPSPSFNAIPVQQLTISQTLVGGTFHDGGTADIFLGSLPSTELPPDAIDIQVAHLPVTLSDLALKPVVASHGHLAMEALVSLPVGEAWPLQTLSQQVRMQVSCGACGPAGGIAHLVGTGRLHIQTASWGTGKISDINLQAPNGRTAHGELHFTMRTSDKAIFTDNEARLHLVVDAVSTDLATQLVAWRGHHQPISGIFVGVPLTTGQDLGAFAGQFSGADCTLDCGVEN